MEDLTRAVELYGAASCPYTCELREHLQWSGVDFVEFDIEVDVEARARLKSFTNGSATVPVLVENGKVTQIGWHGRSCAFAQ